MANKTPNRPGKRFIAGAVEIELYQAFSELAGKLDLNTTQLLRRAAARVLEENGAAVPEVTRQQILADANYRRGRPRKAAAAHHA